MKGEIVVVGGGIAGLTCAAYLARGGARPRLLEASGEVGGYFGSFSAGGYSFDKGLRAIEDGGTLGPMLRQLGLAEELELLPNPVSLSVGGRVFPMGDRAGIAAYFEGLKGLFPAEAGAIGEIGADALAVCALMDGLYGGESPIFLEGLAARRAALPWLLRNLRLFLGIRSDRSFLGQRLDAYLRSRTSDESLARLLSEPFFEGTPLFFGLGYSRLFQDYRYPRGGMRSIPEALARRVESLGGRVETGREVVGIEVEGAGARARARRVLCADGSSYEASQVVYAGDLKRLYLRLLDPRLVPAQLRERIAAGRPSESAFTAYLGVDLPPARFAEAGPAHLLHLPSARFAPRGQGKGEPGYFRATSVEISIPCLRDPSLAPAGKTGLILSAAAWPSDFEGLSGEGYDRRKREIASELVANAEALYPGIGQRVELCVTASPRTMERYTLNSGGAVNGWTADRSRAPAEKDFLSFPKAIATPLANLFQAGHWVFAPAGAPVAIMSGKLAADLALKAAAKGA